LVELLLKAAWVQGQNWALQETLGAGRHDLDLQDEAEETAERDEARERFWSQVDPEGEFGPQALWFRYPYEPGWDLYDRGWGYQVKARYRLYALEDNNIDSNAIEDPVLGPPPRWFDAGYGGPNSGAAMWGHEGGNGEQYASGWPWFVPQEYGVEQSGNEEENNSNNAPFGSGEGYNDD